MLAEIQEANRAFDIIKKTLTNAGSLADCAGSCATYFNCKSIISRRSNKRKTGSQLENFLALEKLREREEWIREWMIYAGRPGLYDDWLKFQSMAKKERAKKERERRAKEQSLSHVAQQWVKWMGVSVSTLASILGAVAEFI